MKATRSQARRVLLRGRVSLKSVVSSPPPYELERISRRRKGLSRNNANFGVQPSGCTLCRLKPELRTSPQRRREPGGSFPGSAQRKILGRLQRIFGTDPCLSVS